MSNNLQATEAYRLKLHAAGFSPVPTEGKAPKSSKWTEICRTADATVIRRYTKELPSPTNTGVLTETVPTLDADLLNPDAAWAVEQLVRDKFGDSGTVTARIGRAPKRAFLFQSAQPYSKLVVNL